MNGSNDLGIATGPGHARSSVRAPATALVPTRNGAAQGLRLLAILRVCAPSAQALTLLVATRQFDVSVPMTPVFALLGVQVLIAVATWMRVRREPRVSGLELVLQAHVDIVVFAGMLYLTGGVTNPFAPLFVVPVAIVASALPRRWVWITVASTIAAFGFLRAHHVPLQHPSGATEVYELHEDGMVANYLLTAALLAFFVSRMHTSLRERERMLADVRDAQMRSESLVAIGALAAGYTHELSTPLATMAVVVAELKREHSGNAMLQRDLQVIDDQIQASKKIVSNLARAGGQQRAEAASGAQLDQFIQAILERARALHPGATITALLDRVTPPPRILAEETLRQAITNLIDNAVRASPQHVEIDVDWSGADLRVAVRDRGPGFTAQMLSRLGKRIEPGNGPGCGNGIGLMLSAATLERLGGRLDLSNEPNGGACAEIRLPLSAILIDTHRSAVDGLSQA